jgi:hypothetical protein
MEATVLDYTPIFDGSMKYTAFAGDITPDELRAEIHVLYDAVRDVLSRCTDEQVRYIPYDADAYDQYAEPGHEHDGWSIGHLVAHITATQEEAAGISSILARGIEVGGRQRYEVAWEELDTVEKALARLEESRRIVLAYLDAWPDTPDYNTLRQFNSEKARAYFGDLNARGNLIMGMAHHAEHLPQFKKVLAQAAEAERR